MKKKLAVLSIVSFVLALSIFAYSYILYHYLTPSGILFSIWQAEPTKPVVTFLLAILGVMFLFSRLMSQIISIIFYPQKK